MKDRGQPVCDVGRVGHDTTRKVVQAATHQQLSGTVNAEFALPAPEQVLDVFVNSRIRWDDQADDVCPITSSSLEDRDEVLVRPVFLHRAPQTEVEDAVPET